MSETRKCSSLVVKEERPATRRPARPILGLTRWDPGMSVARERRDLAAEPEPSDDGSVARVVLLDQVGKKTTALADELEEAASRMVVLGKAPKMLGQPLDPLGQERDLDLRRTGVTVLGGVPGDDLLLLLPRERHSVL